MAPNPSLPFIRECTHAHIVNDDIHPIFSPLTVPPRCHVMYTQRRLLLRCKHIIRRSDYREKYSRRRACHHVCYRFLPLCSTTRFDVPASAPTTFIVAAAAVADYDDDATLFSFFMADRVSKSFSIPTESCLLSEPSAGSGPRAVTSPILVDVFLPLLRGGTRKSC